ncbi:MAG: hypothetical protein H6573_19980 [Lewinellaceae bacterium]|nr:hypothetical protein [Lewinellaceae bacterium]
MRAATLSFLDKQGNRQEWPLDISLRGKFRRMHCKDMPPLRLDFSKKDLEEAGLAQFDDLKLVNYCMGDDRHPTAGGTCELFRWFFIS